MSGFDSGCLFLSPGGQGCYCVWVFFIFLTSWHGGSYYMNFELKDLCSNRRS